MKILNKRRKNFSEIDNWNENSIKESIQNMNYHLKQIFQEIIKIFKNLFY